MPCKVQFYSQMADHTAMQITGSYQNDSERADLRITTEPSPGEQYTLFPTEAEQIAFILRLTKYPLLRRTPTDLKTSSY